MDCGTLFAFVDSHGDGPYSTKQAIDIQVRRLDVGGSLVSLRRNGARTVCMSRRSGLPPFRRARRLSIPDLVRLVWQGREPLLDAGVHDPLRRSGMSVIGSNPEPAAKLEATMTAKPIRVPPPVGGWPT